MIKMNKDRRKKILDIVEKANQIKTELEAINDEEQNVYDSMPENLQNSMRGEDSENAIDCMTEAGERITEFIEALEEI